MLPVGAWYFYQAHSEPTVLPEWPNWAHLFCSVFASVSELRGHASARRVLHKPAPPGALFHAETFALLPCVPNFHLRLNPCEEPAWCLSFGCVVSDKKERR